MAVRVQGTWLKPNGDLRSGRWSVFSNAQVSQGGAIVVPLGLVYSGYLNEDESAKDGVSLQINVPGATDPGVFPQHYALTVVVEPGGAAPVNFTFVPTEDVDLQAHIPDDVVGPNAVVPLPGVGIPGGLATLDDHGYLDLSRVTTQATNLLMVDATVAARPYVPAGYNLLILNRSNSARPLWALPGDLFLFAPQQ